MCRRQSFICIFRSQIKIKVMGIIETPIAPTKRGRPTNPNSANQIKKAAKQSKIEAGIDTKLGRPENPTSARQQTLAARAAAIEAGEVIKCGRKTNPNIVDLSVV